MKKIFSHQTPERILYLMLWALAVTMVSCNDSLEMDISPEVVQLSVNPTSITFVAHDLATQTATVTTNAADWNFSNPASATWLTVERQGNALSFTPKDLNTGTSPRSTIVTITAGTANPVTVQVRQEITVTYPETIVACTYTATATPMWLNKPGASTWTGTIEPVEVGGKKRYRITNWGDLDITIFCDDENGKITIDRNTRVAYNSSYDGYFSAAYIVDNGNTLRIRRTDEYVVRYDSATGIFDFTGTLTVDGITYPAVLGVVAYNQAGSAESVFSDFYADVKFQLPPVQQP